MTVILILPAFILGYICGKKTVRKKKNKPAVTKRRGTVNGMARFWDYDGSEQI